MAQEIAPDGPELTPVGAVIGHIGKRNEARIEARARGLVVIDLMYVRRAHTATMCTSGIGTMN